MSRIRFGVSLTLALVLLGCTAQEKKEAAKVPAAQTDEDNVNLLAADPAQGFKDFKAVGTDGVTTPDCCKVPLPDPKLQDKSKT
jgi:PBP1b-binding outer membrane lipoprotein LpoB